MVTVASDWSECLFRLTSTMVPLQARRKRREQETIVIDIPSLPLTPGDYHLNVQVKEAVGTVDYVHRAAEFTVISADVHGTGYQYVSQDGSFVVPWRWAIHPPTRTPGG
jgi:hypothetical protein